MSILKSKLFAGALLFAALVAWYLVYITQWVVTELERPKTVQGELAADNITVNLSINNAENLEVVVPKGADNCEVLKKALDQGKLDNLKMKYSDEFKTFSVYKINDLGKETEVWWTFEVNGKEPPSGCSLVKVNKGDKINWKYLGEK